MLSPSWGGRALDEGRMGPFGGVPSVSLAREDEAASMLDPAVRDILERGTAGASHLLSRFPGS
jgi:hypothetical protein